MTANDRVALVIGHQIIKQAVLEEEVERLQKALATLSTVKEDGAEKTQNESAREVFGKNGLDAHGFGPNGV